jgi:glycosyltransferase involved in cell wall biosynthesis
MKFSIIIPVHNAEKYLNDCIDSIYSQDISDFEIIFVVNGSNDESENICLMARECHSNIRVIVTDAVGVSSARNIGLREAQGEYVVFVDADDCLLPGALTAFEETCADMPDIVTANYLRNKRKRMSGRVSDPDTLTYLRAMLDAPAFFGELELTWQPIVTYCVFAKAFRRQFLVDNGIYFDTDLAIGEDLIFSMKSALRAELIRCADEAVYYYRPGESTVSSRQDLSGVTKRLASAKRLLDMIDDLPDELRKPAEMKVIDIILRSIVVGASLDAEKNDAAQRIRSFLREQRLGKLFARCRSGSLSIVSIDENICYMKMMESLREGRLSPAFKTAEKYADFLQKKKQIKRLIRG